jgi:O-acetylhomoserine/O-acetylserine sulfhydrylase
MQGFWPIPFLYIPRRRLPRPQVFRDVRFAVKLRIEILRDVPVGACLSPFGAFLLVQGLETLSLRAERHSENALALARYLEQLEKVAWVSYVGLESHPSHQLERPVWWRVELWREGG